MDGISAVSSSSNIEDQQHTPATTRAYSILSGKVQGDCSLAGTSISQVTVVTVPSKTLPSTSNSRQDLAINVDKRIKISKSKANRVNTETDVHNKIGEEEEKQELKADDDLSERDNGYENNDITFRMDKTICEEQEIPSDSAKQAEEDHQHKGNEHEEEKSPPSPPLFKSTRLNGYLRITFLASLCFVSAYESDFEHVITLLIFSDNLDTEESIANTTYGAFQDNITMTDGLVFKSGRPPIIVRADPIGRYHAMVTSGLSASLTMIILACFILDAILPMGKNCRIALRKTFAPKSVIEITLLVFLSVWWIIGCWVITSIGGIAGDGKGQYNLYFSSWMCLIEVLSMNERWLIAAGYSSIQQSVSSWPNRAPGWIMIFIATLSNLICILDLRSNGKDGTEPTLKEKYTNIHSGQWAWLIFVCIISFSIAFFFSIAELFRREQDSAEDIPPTASFLRTASFGRFKSQGRELSSQRSQESENQQDLENHTETKKTSVEMMLEGFLLLLLVILWVPTVVMSTMASKGAASVVGNAYFLTWGSTVIVIHTFIRWLKMWRKGIHEVVIRQTNEYLESQFRASRDMSSIDTNTDGNNNDVGREIAANNNDDKTEHGNLSDTLADGNNDRKWFSLPNFIYNFDTKDN